MSNRLFLKMLHLDNKPSNSHQTEIDPQFMESYKKLERKVDELERQLQAQGGSEATTTNIAAPKRNVSKTSQTVRIPTGRINEVLTAATKQDIQVIRTEWAAMMQQLQKSHAALLEETEPVAASENAFVLKFKYEIHCLMASENLSLRSGLTEALQSRTGKAYEVIYVPEEGWLKVREEFIRNNNLAKRNTQETSSKESNDKVEDMPDFMKEAEQENMDPIVTEAEKIFGKEFIEVHDD